MRDEITDEGRTLKVALEPFARASLEARFGADLSAATIAALRHYARGLRSKRRPL
jgi:hypothetical protein